MKITNPKRFIISCGVIATATLGLTVGTVNVVSNFINNDEVEIEYISTSLKNEIKEAYGLDESDIERGIGTFIKKHPDWEELIQNEKYIISWFAPSTEAMYEFYNEYR